MPSAPCSAISPDHQSAPGLPRRKKLVVPSVEEIAEGIRAAVQATC
jgi:hypothetical protein